MRFVTLRYVLAAVWLAGSAAAMAAGPQSSSHHDHSSHHMPSPSPKLESVELSGVSVPDSELLDQDGNPIHFHSDLVRDKVVVMNFIFTTCTTICPPMGANFGKLQDELGERFGRDVFLISVSVDPTTDTPQRLKAWGERFGARPGWTLVTGPKARIDELLKDLQVFTPEYEDHSPTVLVGNDRAGTWRRAYGLAPTAQLAELIAAVGASGGEEQP